MDLQKVPRHTGASFGHLLADEPARLPRRLDAVQSECNQIDVQKSKVLEIQAEGVRQAVLDRQGVPTDHHEWTGRLECLGLVDRVPLQRFLIHRGKNNRIDLKSVISYFDLLIYLSI